MSRVVMVATSTACEPAAVLASRLLRLLDAGWDARLLCRGDSWRDAAELAAPAVAERVEPVDRAGPLARMGRRQRRLEARLTSLRPDLVHFYSGGAAATALGLCERLGCRVAVSLRPDGADHAEADSAGLWRSGTLFLFQDPSLLERAVAAGCPRPRSELLPSVLAEAEAAAPAMPRAGDGPLRLISAGPLIWERGFEHSLHAVRLALDRGVELRYRILYGGNHLVAVGFARHRLGLEDVVEVPSGVGCPQADALREADLFLDPAVSAGTSDAPRRAAQALGVPFVATHREGLDEDAGIAVPRRDPVAMADAIVSLAADPNRLEAMAEAGRNRGLAGESDSARLQALYRRALGSSRLPAP